LKVWALIDPQLAEPVDVFLFRSSAEEAIRAARQDWLHPEDAAIARRLYVGEIEIAPPSDPDWEQDRLLRARLARSNVPLDEM
jgi:hypothetical protein